MQAVAAPQQLGQFVEIQIDQEQAVAKLMLGGSRVVDGGRVLRRCNSA